MASAYASPTSLSQPSGAHESSTRKQGRASSHNMRFRASKACRRCNEKRVKCDASERGTPCTRCEERQEPDCQLIQSRRGIYIRKPRRQVSGRPSDEALKTPEPAVHVAHDVSQSAHPNLPPQDFQQQQQKQQRHQDTSNLTEVPVPWITPTSPSISSPTSCNGGVMEDQQTGQRERDAPDPAISGTAHVQGAPTAPLDQQDTPSGATDTSNASSYHDVSWAAMFSHGLDDHQKGGDIVDKCSITYFGESFPLAILLRDLAGRGKPPRLHHPGPLCPTNEELTGSQTLQHPPHMRPEDIAFLEAKHVFELPEKDYLDALIQNFVDRVFPLYPIVNLQEFNQQRKAKRIPWILVHALCFISATFCAPSLIHRAGYETRREARWTFYNKAKALFDIGYESNKIAVLQVSILMGFWGGSPNNYWNFYSWISTGVTIAETLGCHRSMRGTKISNQDRSLLKRLWWILVIRDTVCAALVGRPFRVNLDHCDTEALNAQDFLHDLESPDLAASPAGSYFGPYQVEATKLALVLRRIITSRYYPSRDGTLSSASLHRMLEEWRLQLPPRLAWSDTSAAYSNIFTSTLSIFYYHNIILAHLSYPMDMSRQSSPKPDATDASPNETLTTAAQRIASTACAVVTRSDILDAPHELLHGIFVAAVVFLMHSKSASPLAAHLGSSGLINCQMVLHASREHWDPSPWIIDLFDKIRSQPAGNCDVSEEQQYGADTSDTINVQGPGLGVGMMQDSGIFDPNYGMWQSHPILGTLFDVPDVSLMVDSNTDDRFVPTNWLE